LILGKKFRSLKKQLTVVGWMSIVLVSTERAAVAAKKETPCEKKY